MGNLNKIHKTSISQMYWANGNINKNWYLWDHGNKYLDKNIEHNIIRSWNILSGHKICGNSFRKYLIFFVSRSQLLIAVTNLIAIHRNSFQLIAIIVKAWYALLFQYKIALHIWYDTNHQWRSDLANAQMIVNHRIKCFYDKVLSFLILKLHTVN